MGAYRFLEEIYKNKQSDVARFLSRVRTWEYRQLPGVCSVGSPTRPEKARKLGYKAKEGYSVFRCRIRRGDKMRDVSKGICYGKPRNAGVHQQKRAVNHQNEAEQLVGRTLGAAMRILNSYYLTKDGTHKYYEVIAVHPGSQSIRNDPTINWIVAGKHKHREMRGKTSAGRKHRGLRHKGLSSAQLRPSRRAFWKRTQALKLKKYR
eukprot:GHVH01001602.1.p1 GENE.GHVH01001602.1~~GHVH01001602.1.p1  ORF type:complete len:206 (+),score=19.40 GHVH01001602.1:40-657(+)